MAVEYIEFGKKGSSKEINEILSHIFKRNNELNKEDKRGTVDLQKHGGDEIKEMTRDKKLASKLLSTL